MGSDTTQMVELNPTLYLGEEMMELHQKSRETFSPDGSNSDGTGIGGGGGDSPGGASLPDRGTACSDARPNAMSKEVCSLLSTSCFVMSGHALI